MSTLQTAYQQQQQLYQQFQVNQQYYQQNQHDRQSENARMSTALASERISAANNPTYYSGREEAVKSMGEILAVGGCVCAAVACVVSGIAMMGIGIADFTKDDPGDGGTLLGVGVFVALSPCLCALLRIKCR